MSNFWDVFPLIVVFPTIALVTKWFLEYRLRQRLIEKGMLDEKVGFLNMASLGQSFGSSLKWGMVLVLVGIAILVIQMYDISDEAILGLILIAAGAGLLLYYIFADRLLKRQMPR